jgi:predicted HTH transcriptional regulator
MNNNKPNVKPSRPDPALESQTVEWTAAGQDDASKWLCAFANTDGGTLEIGTGRHRRIYP